MAVKLVLGVGGRLSFSLCGPLHRLPTCPHHMAAHFPQSEESHRERENQAEAILSMTQLHSLLEKQVPKSGEGDSTFGRVESQRTVRHVSKPCMEAFIRVALLIVGLHLCL